jgi:hypothetical protein
MRTILIAPLLVLASGCIVIDQMDCRYRDDREQVVPAPASLREVEVKALSGSLEIHGREGSSEVRVTGVACTRRERDLESIEIAARAEGDRVVIEAVIPQAAQRRGARLDLTIELPSSAAVVVDDSSGDTVIDGVAAARIDDGSGDLRLDRVPGEVAIVDRSGDVALGEVGAVRLEDGSGGVIIRGTAAVTVVSDGSGDLEIRDVAGDVRILDDGSGDIEVATVGGDLQVEDAGSGDVEHTGVEGRVEVPSDD